MRAFPIFSSYFNVKFLSGLAILWLSNCQNDRKPIQFYALSPQVFVITDSTVKVPNQVAVESKTAAEGMVFVPSGYAFIGSDSSGLQSENPRFWVYVKSFFMDESPVMVSEFREFVKATGYITEAEKFGNGGFIDETSQNEWILKDGCTWAFPYGKDREPAADDMPVTQVSWNDANAYARWAGKRLPHELEFEHAARNARNEQSLYSIGNDVKTPDGKWRVNIWQGIFPIENRVEDGYKFASPVGIFGKTNLGLTDMTGNVWQWCENGKFSYTDVVAALKTGNAVPENRMECAQRGGSFLCEPTWCHAYRVSGRSFTSPETSLLHVGFRCVKDIN
ncbi:MAG: formylglycine-generating enzyme family protein [Saprospiraceae bacterium]|nr:formylglycine-generating enzyme family protein [Saprospiraceae bacterium]